MAESGPILLVEDNPDDALLIGSAFEKSGIKNRLLVVSTAEDAIKLLNGEGAYCDRKQYPFPVLVLADLKLPGLTGFDFVKWLRAQPDLKRLPVIVLSSSVFAPDVKQAYDVGANSFLAKPHEFSDFAKEVKATADFWLNACQLPSAPSGPSPPP